MLQHFRNTFQHSADLLSRLAEPLSLELVRAVEVCVDALRGGKKILACGNGGSAADCQHFVAELVGRFERERKALAALSLTTDTSILTAVGNDYHYREVFSRQIAALAQSGDVLLAISTSGNSENVIHAVEQAHHNGMKVVFLLGRDGGKLAAMLNHGDVCLLVDDNNTARIQEVHILLLHCLASGIEQMMFFPTPVES